MDIHYKKQYLSQIRRDGNSIGLFLFLSAVATNILSMVIMSGVALFNDNILKQNVSTDDLPNTIIVLFIQCILSIFMFFICGVFYCKVTKTSLNDVVPFKKNNFSTTFLLILLGYSSTFIAAYLSTIFNAGISVFGFKTEIDMNFNSSSWLSLILYILGVAVIPALIEEFVFRGIILGKLRKYGDIFALFTSALLFGLMHGNLQQIPFAFIGGLAFGFITIKANSLLPAIIVHFLNNFVSVIIDITTYNKLISETMLEILYATLMFTALIAGIFSVIILSSRKDFFKIENINDGLLFREKLTSFIVSVGMIIFIINVIAETLLLITMV